MLSRRRGTINARRLLQIDGTFEALLGVLLIVWLSGDDYPAPAGDGVLAAFGVLLIAMAVLLWWLASTNRADRALIPLAAVNAATAVVFTAWALAADGFSNAGAGVLVLTIAMLVGLALAQFTAARRRAPLRGATA